MDSCDYADVAKNLVTNLIVGNDWIQSNNVYILTPEKRIMIKKARYRSINSLAKPPLLNYPATLINHITLPPFSEQMVEAKLPYGYMTDILFEPNTRLQNTALFTLCALVNVRNGKIRISIISATNRQQTLSEGKVCAKLILNGKELRMNNGSDFRNIEITTSCEIPHECREYHQHFTTRSDLFKHFRNECYPDEIRKQINKLAKQLLDWLTLKSNNILVEKCVSKCSLFFLDNNYQEEDLEADQYEQILLWIMNAENFVR